MKIIIGNLFDSKAQTLVNTVNCVGVMGKGIAKEFKQRYPYMFDEYRQHCKDGLVRPGRPYLYKNLTGVSILNFPTKDHWRSSSKMSYIIDGLDWFVEHYEEEGITSIAFPSLGCGNGGLSWDDVGPVMYQKLKGLPIEIEIFAPFGTSRDKLSESFLATGARNDYDVVGVGQSHVNKYWKLLLYVIQRLSQRRYAISVGRTIYQKICYILTRAGIPTGFTFQPQSYGPFSIEAKNAITALSNANLISERPYGRMMEIVVSPEFHLDKSAFSEEELSCTEKALNLLYRVRDTEHAELMTTVLYSYDRLKEKQTMVSEIQIMDDIIQWKPQWNVAGKKAGIAGMIEDLASLGWIRDVDLANNSSPYVTV